MEQLDAMLQTSMQQTTSPTDTALHRKAVLKQGFPKKAAFTFGIGQITFGVIAIVLGSAGLGLRSALSFGETGQWCGVLFIVTGSFGIVSSIKRANCYIITCMVLSIISASLSGTVLLGMGIGAAIINSQPVFSFNIYPPEFDCYQIGNSTEYICSNMDGRIAVNSLLAITAFAEAIIASVTAVFCYRVVCSRRKGIISLCYTKSQQQQQEIPLATDQLIPANPQMPSHGGQSAQNSGQVQAGNGDSEGQQNSSQSTYSDAIITIPESMEASLVDNEVQA
ncbi:uncharacterized protein LOC144452960 [Glandiceps talaboti]